MTTMDMTNVKIVTDIRSHADGRDFKLRLDRKILAAWVPDRASRTCMLTAEWLRLFLGPF